MPNSLRQISRTEIPAGGRPLRVNLRRTLNRSEKLEQLQKAHKKKGPVVAILVDKIVARLKNSQCCRRQGNFKGILKTYG
jgi:hypothetical protein